MPGWYGIENGRKPEMGEQWKTQTENSPQLDKGKKRAKNGLSREFPIFSSFSGHFLAIFWASFFFAVSGFWPFSMPCQPGMIPNLEPLWTSQNFPWNFSHCGTLWPPFTFLRSRLSAPKSHNRTIASEFRIDGAKSPEIIPHKEGVSASEIATRIANRWRLYIAPLNRNAMSRKSLAISGVRDGHRNRK